jgi:hypothetical protein
MLSAIAIPSGLMVQIRPITPTSAQVSRAMGIHADGLPSKRHYSANSGEVCCPCHIQVAQRWQSAGCARGGAPPGQSYANLLPIHVCHAARASDSLAGFLGFAAWALRSALYASRNSSWISIPRGANAAAVVLLKHRASREEPIERDERSRAKWDLEARFKQDTGEAKKS